VGGGGACHLASTTAVHNADLLQCVLHCAAAL